MIKIAPSILSADFGQLSSEIAEVSAAGADWIHLDVMDGHFVPNLTFGPPVIKSLIKQQPHLFWDAHLMVSAPEQWIDPMAEAGVKQLSVHIEATPHLHRCLERIKQNGMRCGVALNPATAANALDGVIDMCDVVLVMSVNPGFGGQRYIESTTRKIADIKQMIEQKHLSVEIEVDGGINAATIASAAGAGASIFVAGSAVFDQPDYAAAMASLRSAAENPQNAAEKLAQPSDWS